MKTFDGAWPQGCPRVIIEQGSDPDPTVSGFATPGTCVVYLTPTFLAQSPPPDLVCAVVVHEFGHLLGLQHSADPSNVMFPSPRVPPACASETSVVEPPDGAQAQQSSTRVPAVDSVDSSAQPTTGSELLKSSGKRRRRTTRRCYRPGTRLRAASTRSARTTRRRACRASA